MDRTLEALDWSLIQSFCSVGELGSLSAAARKLGQSQPTIGRHIKTIENSLGVELFLRGPRGLSLTQVGLDIYDHAKVMHLAAAKLRLTAEGQADAMKGTVRITASVVVSHFILPRIIADIRRDLPELEIELVPSDNAENLIYREADIAVRMYRPTQLDVITRHVADQNIGLFASSEYLDRVGRPSGFKDLLELEFVGFDKNDLMIRAMRNIGMSVSRDFFPVRCDDQAAHWQLVRAGCGVGGMQVVIGESDALVERIPTDFELPTLPVWLVAPEALRSNIRIRKVWDRLAKAFSAGSA